METGHAFPPPPPTPITPQHTQTCRQTYAHLLIQSSLESTPETVERSGPLQEATLRKGV